jgi:hypothetical protein
MEEICIGGGGPKGIAYLGALYELDKNNLLNDTRVYSGSSIGGLFAVLLSIGYKPEELLDKLFEFDFNSLNDLDLTNTSRTKSLMKGNEFKKFIKDLLEIKIDPDITLKELYKKTKKEVILTATCVNDEKIEYISYKTDPELSIFKLICMTTSIPPIFPPIEYKGKYYADGGIIDNLPLVVLKPGSWGITSTSSAIYDKDYSILGYTLKILHIVYTTLQKNLNQFDNVIKIDVKHINVTSFNISLDDKYMLIHNGRMAVKENLEKIKISLI